MDQPTIHKKGKKKKKPKNKKNHQQQQARKRPAQDASVGSKKKSRKTTTSLQSKFKEKLESGQFRWLNEQLYTSTSDDALKLFKKQPNLYDVYHRGFELQVEKWPENPVQIIIEQIRQMPKNFVLGDFGCGTALIARTVSQRVHSFDLCKVNEHVTVANSSNVPLADKSLDVAIFCLSLMGIDFVKFLLEARRVLRQNGLLIVAEVKSRFQTQSSTSSSGSDPSSVMVGGIKAFKTMLKGLGFSPVKEDTSNKMFVLFHFKRKTLSKKQEAAIASTDAYSGEGLLKSCKYKKR